MALSKFYTYMRNSASGIMETRLNGFQRRTGCFVEFASVFGSSQRGYGTPLSDHDVAFVYDYPEPTTLTLKDNIRFKVGAIEFMGMSRKFFLGKLGSSSIHHWIVLLANSDYLLISNSEPYKEFIKDFMANEAMRLDIGRKFMHSGAAQMCSIDHNMNQAYGVAEKDHAIQNNYIMFKDDAEFCVAIKHQLQAIYTVALGLALATKLEIRSHDILDLLKMTELGREIVPDVERLIDLRRSQESRDNFDSKKGWMLHDWSSKVHAYGRTVPLFPYEGDNELYASQYDPDTNDPYNILEGVDSSIRRLIVKHFFKKETP